MIKIFTKHLDDAIKELTWVDRYGGLVTTLNTRIENGDNVFKNKSFPAALNKESCDDITQLCYESGQYVSMFPDTQFKSVVYLEDRTGLNFVRTTGSKGRISEYTATLRLVCWGNGNKLAFDGCNMTDRLTMDLFKKTMVRSVKKSLLPKGVLRIQISPQGTEEQSVKKIFDRYTYEDEMPFMHPHVFFAIRLKLDIRMLSDCLDLLVLSDPNECDPDTRWAFPTRKFALQGQEDVDSNLQVQVVGLPAGANIVSHRIALNGGIINFDDYTISATGLITFNFNLAESSPCQYWIEYEIT